MLDQVLDYVRQVNEGERIGDDRIGRALLETVGVVPSSSTSTTAATVATAAVGKSLQQDGEKKLGFEEEFNAHLADVLMVSYLASVLKTQTEISSRLNLML